MSATSGGPGTWSSPAPADYIAIVELLNRYATALDARDWDLLRTCFETDGTADYPRMGTQHGAESIVLSIRQVVGQLDVTQHVITNHVILTAGDTARTTCYIQSQHVLRDAPGGSTYKVGGRYRDELVRGPEGWRIRHRTLEILWSEGNPSLLPPVLT